jgi:hypothetical protein
MLQATGSNENNEQVLDDLFESITKGDIDLDVIMVSMAHAGKSKGVDAAHLSNIWHITYQNSKRTNNPTLSRNYATNDWMLQYKCIDEYFLMDTFFATKKAGKLSRSNTCCQLFINDKEYLYIVPMKLKIQVLQAVKQFAKEIGAPDAIICDMAGEQISQPLRKLCNKIGTTLQVLEEGTTWANKAKLYIGLIKEAVQKDMKDSNCPLLSGTTALNREPKSRTSSYVEQMPPLM